MEKRCVTCEHCDTFCTRTCDNTYSGWEAKKPVIERSYCKTCASYPGEGVFCGGSGDCFTPPSLDETPLSDTQKKISEICDEVKTILLEKNRKYGDSALNPKRVFSKASPIEQINVRIDDKISRIMSAQDDDTEDAELDLIGYLILKRVAKSVLEGK